MAHTSSDATPVPAVSVLIAVHNGLPYLESAVRSIMEQTLRDIEIVIVDDASTDATPEVLARLAAEDPRIRIETLSRNLRLPGALNRGLDLVRAPYVARMDADDISLPRRLEIQKDYLDHHPHVVLIGAGIEQIDGEGTRIRTSLRARDAHACRWLARFHMPLMHPTFMFRRVAPDGTPYRYDPAWTVSEDYDFAARALETGDVVSLPDILLRYRVHGGSITGTKWHEQLTQAQRIAERVQRAQLPEPIRTRMAPLNAALLGDRTVPVERIFAGLDAMIAHDLVKTPERQSWIRRQAAQQALRALRHSGHKKTTKLVRAFLGPGRSYLWPVAMRALEIKRLIPGWLRSDGLR